MDIGMKNSDGYWYELTYDSNGKLLTYKNSDGYWYERTYDSNGKLLTYKDSDGFSYECTRDSDGNELTYKDSDGTSRGFDKTYTPEEVEFIKRAVQEYWEHCFAEHPDNKKDLKLTEQILNK
jgi:YD repeat-containing protein